MDWLLRVSHIEGLRPKLVAISDGFFCKFIVCKACNVVIILMGCMQFHCLWLSRCKLVRWCPRLVFVMLAFWMWMYFAFQLNWFAFFNVVRLRTIEILIIPGQRLIRHHLQWKKTPKNTKFSSKNPECGWLVYGSIKGRRPGFIGLRLSTWGPPYSLKCSEVVTIRCIVIEIWLNNKKTAAFKTSLSD